MEIQRYASPDLAEHSQRREELSFSVRKLAEDAAKSIEKAPPFNAGWSQLAVDRFDAVFAAKGGQFMVPSLGGSAS